MERGMISEKHRRYHERRKPNRECSYDTTLPSDILCCGEQPFNEVDKNGKLVRRTASINN